MNDNIGEKKDCRKMKTNTHSTIEARPVELRSVMIILEESGKVFTPYFSFLIKIPLCPISIYAPPLCFLGIP